MNGVNCQYRIDVQTPRGILPIHKLIPGDYVYEYRTGNLLEVQDIIKTESTDIWEAEYTDGRKSLHGVTERMYTGDGIASVINCLKFNGALFTGIDQYGIEYPYQCTPLNPDPYTAGTFLMYGDRSDPYLNISKIVPSIESILDQHNHNLFFDSFGDNGKVYFKSSLFGSRKRLMWTDFFPNHDINSIIPRRYRIADKMYRWQFARGVFDAGYSESRFPNWPGIMNRSEGRLRAFQSFLWSLGVTSLIEYDPDWDLPDYVIDTSSQSLPLIPPSTNQLTHNNEIANYRLNVVGKYSDDPGLFNLREHIEIIIAGASQGRESAFDVRCHRMRQLPRGSIHNIVLKEPDKLYLTKNFLPRVSM